MYLESYDLFDTLITRATRRPGDVFQLLGIADVVRFRWKLLGLIPFHIWRRRAERIARWRSPSEDIRLVDVYRVLGLVLLQPARVMRAEISLETAVVRPIPGAVAELIERRERGVPCCIVSDMYLPASVLRRFLRKHNCEVPLHVSSVVGLTKSSGRMFHHVASAHHVPLSAIHHRGDNLVADYSVPLRLGMKATLIPIAKEETSTCAIDVLKCTEDGDPFYEMGFRVAGPTAFVMAACLAERVRAEPLTNLIFAARDMPLVRHAFQLLSPEHPTTYCRISRSAVYRAQWHANSDPRRWFEGAATGKDFFARLGLECPNELRDLCPHQHAQRFLSAVKSTAFPNDCEKEYLIVRDYLKEQGFKRGSIFVDLGWRGSIQDAIADILGPAFPLEGCYFGTVDMHPSKHGLYFEGSRPVGRFHRVLQGVSFFEFVFTEAVPSLARIARNGDAFELIPTADETELQRTSRARIAEGAKAFIDTMIPVQSLVRFRPEKLVKSLDKLYDKYLMHPPDHWVSALDAMTHSGGFGGSGISPLIGDDMGTPFGFLKAPWKGGYVVKHKKSRWVSVLKVMNRPMVFFAYDGLKNEVRRRRLLKLQK